MLLELKKNQYKIVLEPLQCKADKEILQHASLLNLVVGVDHIIYYELSSKTNAGIRNSSTFPRCNEILENSFCLYCNCFRSGNIF